MARRCECGDKCIDKRGIELLKPTVILITAKWKAYEKRAAFFEHAPEFFDCQHKFTRIASSGHLQIFSVHRVVHADVLDG